MSKIPVEEIVWSGSGALLDQPVKVGQYAVEFDMKTGARCVQDNSHTQPLFFHQPPAQPGLDLLTGYDPSVDFINRGASAKPETGDQQEDEERIRDSGLGDLMQWLLANRDQLKDPHQPGRWPAVDFVTTRKTLADLLTTPFKRFNPEWTLRATRFRDTIYMVMLDEPYEVVYQKPFDVVNQLTYSGHRFEELVTSPKEDGPVNLHASNLNKTISHFKCVVKSKVFNTGRTTTGKFHSHSFVMPVEIDSAMPHFSGPADSMSRFVEVKTMDVKYQTRMTFDGQKLLNWWAKNCIAGVPMIFCGFRDDQFKVVDTQMFETDTLPKQCQWSDQRCVDFLDGFLSLVKEKLGEDDQRVVYEFNLLPDLFVKCRKLTATSSQSGPVGRRVVPDWFVREYQQPTGFALPEKRNC